MSLFSWFKKKPSPPNSHEAGPRAATFPAGARDAATGRHGGSHAADTAAETAARRKNERARLRELLYNVVRESMVRVGVLSSSFKFKVLATDPRGRKFIVMMDLSRDFGSEISQLGEIEALICQAAKARHNIVVSSVYWRAQDPATGETAGSTQADAKYHAVVPQAQGASSATPVSAREAAAAPKPKFEPVLPDEVSALKRALASGVIGNATPAPSPPGTSTVKNPALLTGYENTEIIESELPDTEIATDTEDTEAAQTEFLDDEARYPALSPTQYGELR